MNIIDENIKELAEMGCYTEEELIDLRERFVNVFEQAFWEGCEHKQEKVFTVYGNKEDW